MLRLPVQVQLEITNICNLRCRHCYYFDTENMPRSNDLSDKETLQLIQKLVDDKIYSLIITGGEPFVRPTITIKAAEIAKRAGMYVSVNTNLLLLTSKALSRLKELKINSLLVSCPASEPDIYQQITRCGNYNRFRSKLKMLLDSNVSCLVNMVVTQANYQFIRTTAKEMAKLGVKRFAVTPAAPNVKHPDFDSLLSKPQIIDLFEDLKWCVDTLGLEVDSLVALPKCFFPGWYWDNAFMRSRSCQAGRMSVNVSNVGNVRPCPHNPIVYGNLFQESMETIWDKMSIYRDGSIIPSVCKCCPTVLSCKGACRINALAATGKLDGADRLIVGHLELPKNKQSEIEYKDDSIIHFKGKLHWRKETDGYYSISSKNNHGNIMIVNEEMFRFVYWLEKSLPLTVKELMTNSSSSSDRDSFLNILKSIIRKEFVFVA